MCLDFVSPGFSIMSADPSKLINISFGSPFICPACLANITFTVSSQGEIHIMRCLDKH